MGLLQSNSNSEGRETRRERRRRLNRWRDEQPSHAIISPFWGLKTAFHLWEVIFLESPIAEPGFNWPDLLDACHAINMSDIFA